MLQRMSIAEFLGVLIRTVEERTGIPCVDSPDGQESPFYSVELMPSEPANTKTMFVERYRVWLHCIAAPVKPHSSAPVLRLAQKLEEALTGDIPVQEPFRLVRQTYEGVQALKRDESGEGHAVLAWSFEVCYGFKCK